MDSLETDDQFIIVNRSREHRISKKVIRKVPYFEKLLSHECLESKENKVELDFDEKALILFLKWVAFDYLLIEMKNVISLYNMIDYFGVDSNLIQDCATYFRDNFSISHLPVVISQVTPTSQCINSGALDAFICRHFLKIAKSKAWLNYPIETIEYICALDLVIHSEMQVFNAIMRWIDYEAESSKIHLERLLKLIRWCHLSRKDLSKIKENDCVKSSNFEPIFCTPVQCNGYCTLNRINQYYYVLIEELDGTDLQIKVLTKNFMPFIKRVIKLDESMPLNLLHNDHVCDIVFDSGRKMIRVDWNQNKYRLIGLEELKSHTFKIRKCIPEKKYDELYDLHVNLSRYYPQGSLLDLNGEFLLISTNSEKMFCCLSPSDARIERFYHGSHCEYLATVLDNKIYIMTSSHELFEFNIDSGKTQKFTRKGEAEFRDLFLISKPEQDKIMLIDKSKEIVDCFNVRTKEWSPFGIMVNNFTSTGNQRKLNKLLTFTSAFLPINTIRSCIKRERKPVE
ncbi:uncharacterized protein LOC107370818 [Tetranychus urticae]|uniref:BACK domain-containing protein n=1 Tax=Tetranychus urticae TaxID=32264 RepID=T1JXL5_TETUR|nr:uncharacterized protein LOC107370818 [Tetranychus urticae]